MTKSEALGKLSELIKNIEELQQFQYQDPHPLLDKFISRGERHLTGIFGKENKYLSNFNSIDYYSPSYGFISNFDDTAIRYQENNQAYHKGLIVVQTLIESAIEEIEEWKNDTSVNITLTQTPQANTSNEVYNHITENVTLTQIPQTSTSNKVFIVHGHDNGAKQEVARFLEKLGLDPIILHEQASGQRTIIEKIEEYTGQVGFGVVLYTECDVGGKDKDSLQSRARQNVVFEHGYLIGLLGRNRVCPLVKGKVETPGDISGVVYTQMDDNGSWHLPLVKELKAAGYDIDSNKLI